MCACSKKLQFELQVSQIISIKIPKIFLRKHILFQTIPWKIDEQCKCLIGIIQTSMHNFIKNKNKNVQIRSENSRNWYATTF